MADELTPKQRSAIERVKRSPELQPILFRKAKGLIWLMAFQDAGFLNPEDIPAPVPAKESGYVVVPVWPITDYLVGISEQLKSKENEAAAQVVLDFIRAVFQVAKTRGTSNYRVWWQFARLISAVPVKLLDASDALMVGYWLDDPHDRGLITEVLGQEWLPRLLDVGTESANELALLLSKEFYKVRFVDGRSADEKRRAYLRMDAWHARKFTAAIAAPLGAKLGVSAIEFLAASLDQVLDELDNDSWTSLWRPAIESHEQNKGRDEAEHLVLEALRDVLAGYLRAQPNAGATTIDSLLASNRRLFHRIAINATDSFFSTLRPQAESVICKSFFSHHYQHELWHLLHHHYSEFTDPTRRATLSLIHQTGAEWGKGDPRSIAYQTAIWLSAIRQSSIELELNYLQLVATAGAEPDHPDFSSYMTSGWVRDQSPIAPEDLQAMPANELLHRLNSFESGRGFTGPNVRGLAKAFHESIKATPETFVDKLDALVDLNPPYLYELIDAFGELWSQEAKLPWHLVWPQLLQFCDAVVNSEAFWAASASSSEFVGTPHWVVGAIARLIEHGCKSDDHAFEASLKEPAERIIRILLARQPGEPFGDASDSVSFAINSPRGRCLDAFVSLALRACRLGDKELASHVIVWSRFQPLFDEELGKRYKGEYEFSALIASYLPQFLYMSKDWTLANLHRIFDPNEHRGWLCAMQGYSYVSTVYQEIYGFLSNGGHLVRALDDADLSDRVKKMLVQHVSVAYLNDFELLENGSSMIATVIARARENELDEVIWFFWTLRPEKKALDEKTSSKVLALWPRILASIDFSTSNGQNIASHLCHWLTFVDQVNDDNRSLIYSILPYSAIGFRTQDVVECVARVSVSQPDEAAQIWIRVLEHTQSDYPEEAVDQALLNIARHARDGMRLAKTIADQYLRAGSERPGLQLRNLAPGSS